MAHSKSAARLSSPARILAGGGKAGALMRAIDWSTTDLGPVEAWPQSLRTAVSICLSSRFPILIWWGPHLVKLYNDAYRPILGAKHPAAMGQRGRDCWPEIWHIIGPMLQGVLDRAEATWSVDQMLPLNRHGYVEECYFTFSYSPIQAETGQVGGVFTAVTETTARVLAERRLQTLRDLGAGAGEEVTVSEAGRIALETLAANPADVPFALLYLVGDRSQEARLAGAAGVEPGQNSSPTRISLSPSSEADGLWPLAQAFKTGQDLLVEDLAARFGSLPAGPWPEPPHAALVLRLAPPGQDRPVGFLVAGISSRRELDEDYRGFFDLVAGQVAAAIATARALEAERQRAEALAELNRAKTEFFSNVSHEFRTPLTLILGPLKDALAGSFGPLLPQQQQALELMRRNTLRLLKLVNTLLDFSSIEAGRLHAAFEPIDLAAYTAELASVFRSAIERAGLRLVVDCPPLPEPVYVDREMWEKIVLNLLSNAFKHTFEGEISVTLQARPQHVVLTVSDTGAGIPPEELPHIFSRFHRVKSASARSHEGSGIGLALVQELVRMHHGQVTAASQVGQGATFAVQVPRGSAHLPPEQIRPAPSMAPDPAPYGEEALRWLPDTSEATLLAPQTRTGTDILPRTGFSPAGAGSGRVLLVEDNADMRSYLLRLLSTWWTVESAADGRAALVAARNQPPDLVLADVMMPGLDGFELLRALRAESVTRGIPVILLSARAGEEAAIEALQAGADDYIIKPFSARELLARVGAHLELARLRRELAATQQAAQTRLEETLESIGDALFAVDREWHFVYLNRQAEILAGRPRSELLGQNAWTAFPDLATSSFYRNCQRAMRDRVPVQAEQLYQRADRWLETRIYPVSTGLLVFVADVSAQKEAERALQQSQERFRVAQDLSLDGFTILRAVRDEHGRIIDFTWEYANPAAEVMLRRPAGELVGKRLLQVLPGNKENSELFERYVQVVETGQPHDMELRYQAEGINGWFRNMTVKLGDGVAISFSDITARKQAELALRDSLREKEVLLREVHHRVKNNLQAVSNLLYLQASHSTDDKIRHTLQDSQDRIKSIALIHEKLYQARDLALIDFAGYVRSLADSLIHSYRVHAASIDLVVRVEELPIDLDTAIPLGVMINELVSNALKHAFPDPGSRPAGQARDEIRVELARLDDQKWLLSVSDNGIGFPEDMDPARSLGLQLVQMLAGHMQGSVTFNRQGGSTVKVSFVPFKT